MALLMMLSSVLAARLVARIGIRATMATGILLGGAGLALMASIVSVNGGYLSVLPGMLAMGVGVGLAMTPSTAAITSSRPHHRQGVANAVAAAGAVGPQAHPLVRAAQESFVDGWQNAMWAGAAVMAVLFIYVLARGPQQATRADDRAEDNSDVPAAVTG
jgi:MFS family permease